MKQQSQQMRKIVLPMLKSSEFLKAYLVILLIPQVSEYIVPERPLQEVTVQH